MRTFDTSGGGGVMVVKNPQRGGQTGENWRSNGRFPAVGTGADSDQEGRMRQSSRPRVPTRWKNHRAAFAKPPRWFVQTTALVFVNHRAGFSFCRRRRTFFPHSPTLLAAVRARSEYGLRVRRIGGIVGRTKSNARRNRGFGRFDRGCATLTLPRGGRMASV